MSTVELGLEVAAKLETEAEKQFGQELARDGFQQIIDGGMPANCFNDFHTHSFDVRALVKSGEITLTINGQTRAYCPGQVFVMPVGVAHQENVGPDGVEYVYGRRDPSEPG